jgi:UDP-N-acetylglucosamine--N-acetylmuramyl-(pentapeptide) pyrophosphoryl-undecaprenol N-acetylglucosamine transferase
VYPLLAVAQELQRIAIDEKLNPQIYYLGPRDHYSVMLERNGISVRWLTTGKVSRFASSRHIIEFAKFLFSIPQAFFKVFCIMPDVIFSKGGAGAFPVVLAGWFYRIPRLIHDSDAVPGLNTVLSARFASRIAVSFESALKYFNPTITACVGNPVRLELLRERMDQAQGKEKLGFSEKEPLTLIFCGSQGSQRINEFILTNLPAILKETQLLHQTGYGNFDEVEKLSRAALSGVSVATEAKHRYHAVPFFDDTDLPMALSAADLVVGRAGSSIFELAAFGKPAIVIPLPESAQDHQRLNAFEFAKGGAAVIIEESNLLPSLFIKQLHDILANPETLSKMGKASSAFFKSNAARAIAEELIRLA